MEIVVAGRHTEVLPKYRAHVEQKLAKVEQLAPRAQRIDVLVSHETNPRQAGSVRARRAHGRRPRARDPRRGVRRRPVRGARPGARRSCSSGCAARATGARTTATTLRSPRSTSGRPSPNPRLPAPRRPGRRRRDDARRLARASSARRSTQAQPMTVDDALYEMELVGHDFFLFIDAETAQPSVAYRRRGLELRRHQARHAGRQPRRAGRRRALTPSRDRPPTPGRRRTRPGVGCVPVSGAAAGWAVPARERSRLSQARRIALRAQGLDRPAPGPRRASRPCGSSSRSSTGWACCRSTRSTCWPARTSCRCTRGIGRVRPGAARPGVGRGAAPARRDVGAHGVVRARRRRTGCWSWRQRAYPTEAWGAIAEVPLQHAPMVDEIRAHHRRARPDHRARGAGGLRGRAPDHARREWGWNWTVAKRVLEFLFFTGEVTSAGRNGAFERRYDLTSRVLPADVLAAPGAVATRTRSGRWSRSAPARTASARCAASPTTSASSRRRVAAGDRRPRRGGRARARSTVDGWDAGPVCRHRDATCRAGPPGARCSTRSTRSCSSAAGSRRCSGCATASRSTCPSRSGCGATTCCRSCSASRSRRSSTSRRTGRPACCACTRRTGARVRRPDATWSSRWRRSCARSRAWLGLGDIVVGDRRDCAATSRSPAARGAVAA